MRTHFMRWLAALLAAAMLLGCWGCGVKKSNDSMMEKFEQKISEQGYTIKNSYAEGMDEDIPQLSQPYYSIENEGLEDLDTIFLYVDQTAAGIKSVELTLHTDATNANIDPLLFLAGSLMQVYDPLLKSGVDAAKAAAQKVIDAQNQGNRYTHNKLEYSFELGTSYIYFAIKFPRSNYAVSLSEIEKAQASEMNWFDFSKQEFLDSFGAMVGKYGYALEQNDKLLKTLADSADLLLSDKPEVYAIVHEIGFTDGYVLLYQTGQKLVNIVLIKNDESTHFLEYDDFAAMLIRACDATLSDEPNGANQDAVLALLDQLKDKNSLEQNGVRYSYRNSDVEDWSIAVDVP